MLYVLFVPKCPLSFYFIARVAPASTCQILYFVLLCPHPLLFACVVILFLTRCSFLLPKLHFSRCTVLFAVAQGCALLGASRRGSFYILCSAISRSNIQWLQLTNEWPLRASSHCVVTWPLTLHSPRDHKKCWQPKCSPHPRLKCSLVNIETMVNMIGKYCPEEEDWTSVARVISQSCSRSVCLNYILWCSVIVGILESLKIVFLLCVPLFFLILPVDLKDTSCLPFAPRLDKPSSEEVACGHVAMTSWGGKWYVTSSRKCH